MPLLDHFHPPLHPRRCWQSFYSAWLNVIADSLNLGPLPADCFAEGILQPSHPLPCPPEPGEDPRWAAVLSPSSWLPPEPGLVLPAVLSGQFAVLVYRSEDQRLVSAVILVAPTCKDRPHHRPSQAIQCASYLARGVNVVLIDIVTGKRGNLHNELMRLLGHDERSFLPRDSSLLAVAYRPVVRGGVPQIEVWPSTLGVGQPLPVLPLALGEVCLPLDLETTYMAACQRRRLL